MLNSMFFPATPFLALLFVWAIVYVVIRAKRQRSEARREVLLALLNKFESAEEMTRFLSTDEGRRLVDQLAAPTDEDPRQRAAGIMVPGCILLTMALGFVYLHFQTDSDLVIPAVVIGAVAVGLFAGAALSYWASKRLGLIPKDR